MENKYRLPVLACSIFGMRTFFLKIALVHQDQRLLVPIQLFGTARLFSLETP
jgi:hypothetical protein